MGCSPKIVAEPIKTIIPDRPRISADYETALKKCPIDLQKMAILHEWEWNFWGDKMVDRLK